MTHTPVSGEMSHKELLPVIKGVNNRIKQFSLLNQAPECTIDAVFTGCVIACGCSIRN